jgi:hypothetical protein
MHVSAMTLSILLNFYIVDLIYYKMESSLPWFNIVSNINIDSLQVMCLSDRAIRLSISSVDFNTCLDISTDENSMILCVKLLR